MAPEPLGRQAAVGGGGGRPPRDDRVMRSTVHPTYKTHSPVGNWRVYERAFVPRGDVTLWLSPQAKAEGGAPPTSRPGGQPRFSDLAIEAAHLRLVFPSPFAAGSITSWPR